MSEAQTFLPASLRPAQQAPRKRTRLPVKWWCQFVATALVIFGAGILLSRWRVEVVEITDCPGLPASAVTNLEEIKGFWIPSIDLDKIRHDVEMWPGVAGVAIELKLPSTIRIQALPDEICASIAMGRTWRGINCNGRLSRRLAQPKFPILVNFSFDEAELRSALSAGSRICDGTTGQLKLIRKITPSDFEITIQNEALVGATSIVKVLPQGSPSEQWWRTAALNGQAPAWADLRFDQRIVIRRAG